MRDRKATPQCIHNAGRAGKTRCTKPTSDPSGLYCDEHRTPTMVALEATEAALAGLPPPAAKPKSYKGPRDPRHRDRVDRRLFRLPDGSRLNLVYCEASETWTGTLTVWHVDPQSNRLMPEVFTDSAPGCHHLASKLGRKYLEWAAARKPAPAKGGAA